MKSATVIRLRPDRTAEVVDLADTEAACKLLQRELFVIGRQLNGFQQLATKAGLCRVTVIHLAYGDTTQPRFGTVIKLLKALGWTLMARR